MAKTRMLTNALLVRLLIVAVAFTAIITMVVPPRQARTLPPMPIEGGIVIVVGGEGWIPVDGVYWKGWPFNNVLMWRSDEYWVQFNEFNQYGDKINFVEPPTNPMLRYRFNPSGFLINSILIWLALCLVCKAYGAFRCFCKKRRSHLR
ncbi:MAG: hypothetical protein FWE21_00655 [Defluviitaleaceae bacterium]|nr:hypothetical protein [Defluviitaleaceae bacterium]